MQQTQQGKIRVLVGNSSVRSRMVLSGMIDAEPFMEVVDTAQTKEELLYKAIATRPDVIITHQGLTTSGTLPAYTSVFGEGSSMLLLVSQEMSGHTFTQPRQFHINGYVATPVEGEKETFKDRNRSIISKLRTLVAKVTHSDQDTWNGNVSLDSKFDFLTYRQDLVQVVPDKPLCVVVLGASTGGSTAIEYIVKDLEIQQPTVILVAVHMPHKFTKRLAQRLQKLTNWRVEEGYQGMKLAPNTVVIAPGGFDMRVTRKALRPHLLTLELEPSHALDSPSVNVLMQSAALCAQEQVMGVIMTGMGQDGTAGAQEIKRRGGLVIAQDEASSSIFGMAKAAIEDGAVHGVFALGQIHAIINRFVADRNRSHMLQQIAVG